MPMSNPIFHPSKRVEELLFVFQRALNQGLHHAGDTVATAKSTNHIDASFWGFLRFFGVPELLKDVDRFEKEMGEKGIGQVSKEILEKLGMEVSTKTPEWMKQEGVPILFYGNHKGFTEPLLIASQCTRDDIGFVGNEFARRAGPNAAKYVLPVLAKRYAKDEPVPLSSFERTFMGAVGGLSMTKAEIVAMNAQSISDAVQKISDGGAMGIFPTPGLDVTYPWFSGIGKIIRALPPAAFDAVRLAPIRCEDISFLDVARAVRTRYKKNKTPRKKSAEVLHGSLRSLKELGITASMSDKAITKILQKDYLQKFEEK